ncbi:hypothetical protein XarbCFBP7614_11510 [Xanthomonas arboricola]|nr:hypothetical protein XarbCFBP7614_11510 [Xanthomonas arboricola]
MSRGRGALATCGTRRASVRGGSLAASMPPRVPQAAGTPHRALVDGRVKTWFCFGGAEKFEIASFKACLLLEFD